MVASVKQHQPEPYSALSSSSSSDKSGVMRAIYKMNWMLIYYVAVLLELIMLTVKAIKIRMAHLTAALMFPKLKGPESTVDLLLNHKEELKKHPNHLAVILSSSTVQYEDLSKLIHWSMALGLECFSLYDPKGLLRDHREEFEKYVLGHQIVPGKVMFVDAVANRLNNNNLTSGGGPNNNDAAVKSRNYAEGQATAASTDLYEKPPTEESTPLAVHKQIPNGNPRAIRVYYITEENGKPEIAELCRKFSESIKNGTLTIDQINIDFVDEQLREEFNQMPDPDLALYTGKYCCTYGFLPWHIRLTEFIPIGKDLIVQDFVSVLYKYAKKEQRYGK